MLVAGGYNNSKYLQSVEIYDPSTASWTIANSMAYIRAHHTASVLANGQVFVTGGYTGGKSLNSTELFDPSTGVWTLAANMSYARR